MPAEAAPGLYRLPGVAGVNAYIWHPRPEQRSLGEPILFDCGWPWSGQGLTASLIALGCQPEELRSIAITHDDIDHVGRLASLRAISGATVMSSILEAPRLASSRWRNGPGTIGPVNGIGVIAGQIIRRWPHHPVKVDRQLQDGEELPGGWVAVYTPGHTPGHTAYFHPAQQLLIAGDALGRWGEGLRAPMPAYTEDGFAAAESIRKLATLAPKTICFGHRAVLHDAAPVLQAFAATIAS
jgi:glyoxylase-like metal-dependent hydrolase (beta-lactamase superfamily II)